MSIKKKRLKCPHCAQVYPFSEVLFPVSNDDGYWVIGCEICEERFFVPISNPKESSLDRNYLVESRLCDAEAPGNCKCANEIVEFDFDLNRTSFYFNYSSPSIYFCKNTRNCLEGVARDTLSRFLSDIVKCHQNMTNFCLSHRCPEYKYFVVSLTLDCVCEDRHIATYYCPFSMNGRIPSDIESYHLADISETDFYSGISGIRSKSDIMSYLEKFLIRWNLLADQIVIAAPFVGHQFLSKEQKLEVWNWLLTQLDSEKSIFITRAATLRSYKQVLERVDGLESSMLKEFDLENRIVSANTKKNDFHAKFYVGIIGSVAEVLSGSANLVSGPSMENVGYSGMTYDSFIENYWKPLDLQYPLQNPKKKYWAAAHERDGEIVGKQGEGECIISRQVDFMK